MGKRKDKARRNLLEPTHERAGLRLIQRAINGGWQIPEELMSQLPRVVTGMVANARNDRERLRAVEVLVSMQRDNTAALVAADKVERLDDGSPTEVIELAPITLRAGGGGA